MGRKRMGAAELSPTRGSLARTVEPPGVHVHARRVAVAYAGLWTFTCLGVLIGAAAPGLAPGSHPHPALHGTLGDFASIVIANARVLSAPFLLAAFRFPFGQRSRQLGDLLVVGLLASNALRVGLALGRWQGRLIPFVPQLPLEYLAASTAATIWLDARRCGNEAPDWRTTASCAALTALLLAAAAVVEVLATPHAR
ncbi:MAG: hypothetical protein ACR2ND_15640 [Solirubrobacteraceae bacterium]